MTTDYRPPTTDQRPHVLDRFARHPRMLCAYASIFNLTPDQFRDVLQEKAPLTPRLYFAMRCQLEKEGDFPRCYTWPPIARRSSGVGIPARHSSRVGILPAARHSHAGGNPDNPINGQKHA